MGEETKTRIDKWLWAARFFKNRSAAAAAVSSGKVKVNGERVKPAHPVRPADELLIRKGSDEFVVLVQGLSSRRGPAQEAQKLYEETSESIAKRAELALFLKAQSASTPAASAGRPSKRDRQAIKKLRGK